MKNLHIIWVAAVSGVLVAAGVSLSARSVASPDSASQQSETTSTVAPATANNPGQTESGTIDLSAQQVSGPPSTTTDPVQGSDDMVSAHDSESSHDSHDSHKTHSDHKAEEH
ncbi:MAG: hypothetical protein ACRDG3_13375 [Tepidiformaceae bacterium]